MQPAVPPKAAAAIQKALQHGLALHQAGKLAEAEAVYASILAAQPANPEALRLRGSVLIGLGRTPEGLASSRAAVAAAPNSPEAHYSLGNALLIGRRTQDAVLAYGTALKLRPKFPEALWNLGNAYATLESWGDAAAAFQKAATLAPKNATLSNNLSVALRKLGRLEEAIAAARRAVALDGRFVDALNNLGIAYKESGKNEEAIAAYRKAASIDPNCFDTYYNLGLALGAAGNRAEEEQAYLRAVALKPNSAPALLGLGAARQDLDRLEEAREAYRLALQYDPQLFKAWRNLGATLQKEKRFDEALEAYKKYIGEPDADLLNNMAACLLERKRWVEAERQIRNLLASFPSHAGGWTNLGFVLNRLGRLDEAESALRRSIELNGQVADAHSNLGNVLIQTCRYAEALESYRKASAIDPEFEPARFNESIIQLVTGDFAAGWKGYELRLNRRTAAEVARFANHRRWDSTQPLVGKTLLVHAEQGFGDTLQFIRYIPILAQRGARVIVEVQKAVRPLFTNFPGIAELITSDTPLPAFDFYCPLLSLPLELGTRLDSIPPVVPIGASPEKLSAWAQRVANVPKPRVGFVWSGNPIHENDRNRSIPLDVFRRLFDALPNVHFYSLQKNPRPEESAVLATISNVTNIGPEFADFTDTAALIGNLDEVITVDTAVAHLAGSIGRPVSILIPYAPEWRWLQHGTASPWYPSATICRQPAFGDWAAVLDTLITRLRR